MKDQQERAELLAELRMRFPSRVLEWAARLLEEDGREIEKLRSDLFLARDALACVEQQYRNAMDPTFAGIIANPRAEKAEAELARITDILAELADLMDATVRGDYKPDSFTTQPARLALSPSPSGEHK
jgi:hypothetical protein